jgi:hypothetical protein
MPFGILAQLASDPFTAQSNVICYSVSTFLRVNIKKVDILSQAAYK